MTISGRSGRLDRCLPCGRPRADHASGRVAAVGGGAALNVDRVGDGNLPRAPVRETTRPASGLYFDTSTSRVSGSNAIATRLIALVATMYQAGETGLPVAASNQVTTSCVVPPNTVAAIA